ncbi:hypothetical protein ACQJBY_006679 [Aegilops geniculata]
MAASQEYMDKALLRRSYRNVWHTDLTNAIQADFPYCCLSPWCGPCVSYMLRRRALYNDMSRYVCCAGYMPCSGRCGESKCPELCLAAEAFLCFGSSVASTRFLLQDEFNIQTTQCDNCIIVLTTTTSFPLLSSFHNFASDHNLPLNSFWSLRLRACRASCSASSSWPASAPWSPASSATRNSPRLRRRSPASPTRSTGRFAPVCR